MARGSRPWRLFSSVVTESGFAKLPCPWGEAVGDALIRSVPEDFMVRELPLVEASGSGEHVLVHLRKRGWTTPEAAAALARAFGVAKGRVSYAGMKDRHALTEQWFSVHAPGRALALTPRLPEGLVVLDQQRHGRKLRRGALRGNRFELRLRGVTAPPRMLNERLLAIAHRGVPNYFGRQRFGRDGDNAHRARAWLCGEQSVKARAERGILLSAARSLVFNEVLAARVEETSWDRPIDGDRMMLDGRRSLFSAATEEAGRLGRRVATGAIHPTGPLPGRSAKLPGPEPLPAVERRVCTRHQALIDGLAAAGAVADRRALRVRAGNLAWCWYGRDQLVVGFDLPPGAYATTVIEQALRLREASSVS